MARSADSAAPKPTTGRAVPGWPWYLAAILACLTVLLINGGPLFYFDTAGYLNKGGNMLDLLESRFLARPDGGDTLAAALTPGTPGAGDVDGSHSMSYALMLSILARLGVLEAMVFVNSALVLGVVWLLARVAKRAEGLPTALPLMVALPILAAGLTALPFYTALLMPDIFTPLLILLVALLTTFWSNMRLWEIAVALFVGSMSVVVHLSHLAIAGLLIPTALLGALLLRQRRWWIPPLLVALLFASGLAEKRIFEIKVEENTGGQVVYKPFLTARLIVDGPGYDYLERHCPDPEIDTCLLWDALHWSDDPYRLTASHILFETSARLGSFQRMSPSDRRKVATAQKQFFFRVLAEAPVATTTAIAMNMLNQARVIGISMTLHNDLILARLHDMTGLAFSAFDHGRLTANIDWVPTLERVHEGLYILSTLLLAGVLVWPGALSGRARVLFLMILAGIMINALICGGVSQPAPRYGARVAWLLPFSAALALLMARARNPGR